MPHLVVALKSIDVEVTARNMTFRKGVRTPSLIWSTSRFGGVDGGRVTRLALVR